MLNTSSALDTMTKTCNEKQSWNNHRNIAAFSWPSCCSGVPACYLTRSVTRSLNFLNGFSSLPCLKSDMLSHILWSVCLIRWRLTLPFSINVPFYFKWGLFFFFKICLEVATTMSSLCASHFAEIYYWGYVEHVSLSQVSQWNWWLCWCCWAEREAERGC